MHSLVLGGSASNAKPSVMLMMLSSSGDSICDAEFNTKACKWDGGDCCEHSCIGPTCGSGIDGYKCKMKGDRKSSDELLNLLFLLAATVVAVCILSSLLLGCIHCLPQFTTELSMQCRWISAQANTLNRQEVPGLNSTPTEAVLHADHILQQPQLAAFACGDVSDGFGAQCSICLGSLDGASRTQSLACGHMFHRNCIVQWLSYGLSTSHMTCPECRTAVNHNFSNNSSEAAPTGQATDLTTQ